MQGIIRLLPGACAPWGVAGSKQTVLLSLLGVAAAAGWVEGADGQQPEGSSASGTSATQPILSCGWWVGSGVGCMHAREFVKARLQVGWHEEVVTKRPIGKQGASSPLVARPPCISISSPL